MQIYFTGNTTPVKSFNIGIKGNNAADTIEFILDAQQGNVDLSACTAYVKSASPITSFADKQRVEIQSADEGKIKVSWSMLRKHTLNHSLNVQLQFEDYDRDICWQTVSLQIHFDKTVDADTEIENQNPSIIQDLCKRVGALESKENPTQFFDSLDEFPTIGSADVLYVDIAEDRVYRWDGDNLKYICVGSDYEQIKFINGGTL